MATPSLFQKIKFSPNKSKASFAIECEHIVQKYGVHKMTTPLGKIEGQNWTQVEANVAFD